MQVAVPFGTTFRNNGGALTPQASSKGQHQRRSRGSRTVAEGQFKSCTSGVAAGCACAGRAFAARVRPGGKTPAVACRRVVGGVHVNGAGELPRYRFRLSNSIRLFRARETRPESGVPLIHGAESPALWAKSRSLRTYPDPLCQRLRPVVVLWRSPAETAGAVLSTVSRYKPSRVNVMKTSIVTWFGFLCIGLFPAFCGGEQGAVLDNFRERNLHQWPGTFTGRITGSSVADSALPDENHMLTFTELDANGDAFSARPFW